MTPPRPGAYPPPPEHGYGYGIPGPAYGYPALTPPTVSDPTTGWLMLAGGVLAIIGSLSPWVTAQAGPLQISANGTAGDGVLTLICALPVVVAGVVIGVRQGRLWAGIVGMVFASLIALIALVDVANISTRFGQDFYIDVTVQFGLWLTVIAGALSAAAAIAALVRRKGLLQRH